MGAPNRFRFGLTGIFGIGVRFSRFPYYLSIDLFIPFLFIGIGLGKPYTEN
jgi:hypothetical protein